MNATQRKTLNEYISKLENIQADLQVIRDEIDQMKDTEQEKYDNMPESFQDGEKGEKLQQVIDYLEESVNAFESANDSITEMKDGIENAIQD
jgi:exonuclease VII small subunit